MHFLFMFFCYYYYYGYIFVDFFRDVSCDSYCFSIRFGRAASRNGFENYRKRRETSLKKSKKRQAIASAGSGALGSLWGLWELLGGSWRAWGGLQGAPYIDKTPDQPHGGRHVIPNILEAAVAADWK